MATRSHSDRNWKVNLLLLFMWAIVRYSLYMLHRLNFTLAALAARILWPACALPLAVSRRLPTGWLPD